MGVVVKELAAHGKESRIGAVAELEDLEAVAVVSARAAFALPLVTASPRVGNGKDMVGLRQVAKDLALHGIREGQQMGPLVVPWDAIIVARSRSTALVSLHLRKGGDLQGEQDTN